MGKCSCIYNVRMINYKGENRQSLRRERKENGSLPESWQSEFHSRDEVLTLLIHLGYLTYDQEGHRVSIPNKEVASEFLRSIRELDSWSETANSVQESRKLLQSLWKKINYEDKITAGYRCDRRGR